MLQMLHEASRTDSPKVRGVSVLGLCECRPALHVHCLFAHFMMIRLVVLSLSILRKAGSIGTTELAKSFLPHKKAPLLHP